MPYPAKLTSKDRDKRRTKSERQMIRVWRDYLAMVKSDVIHGVRVSQFAISTDPRQMAFWEHEFIKFLKLHGATILDIYFDGLDEGIGLLKPEVQLIVDWDLINQDAANYLRNYSTSWLRTIEKYTRDETVKTMDAWMKSGAPLPDLTRMLEPIFGKDRAERIAVTETTRLYADANQDAWQSTGFISTNVWRTANDDKVCPICAPLEGMEVNIGQNEFTDTPGEMGITGPPAHVNCRCALFPGDVQEQGFREALRKQLG